MRISFTTSTPCSCFRFGFGTPHKMNYFPRKLMSLVLNNKHKLLLKALVLSILFVADVVLNALDEGNNYTFGLLPEWVLQQDRHGGLLPHQTKQQHYQLHIFLPADAFRFSPLSSSRKTVKLLRASSHVVQGGAAGAKRSAKLTSSGTTGAAFGKVLLEKKWRTTTSTKTMNTKVKQAVNNMIRSGEADQSNNKMKTSTTSKAGRGGGAKIFAGSTSSTFLAGRGSSASTSSASLMPGRTKEKWERTRASATPTSEQELAEVAATLTDQQSDPLDVHRDQEAKAALLQQTVAAATATAATSTQGKRRSTATSSSGAPVCANEAGRWIAGLAHTECWCIGEQDGDWSRDQAVLDRAFTFVRYCTGDGYFRDEMGIASECTTSEKEIGYSDDVREAMGDNFSGDDEITSYDYTDLEYNNGQHSMLRTTSSYDLFVIGDPQLGYTSHFDKWFELDPPESESATRKRTENGEKQSFPHDTTTIPAALDAGVKACKADRGSCTWHADAMRLVEAQDQSSAGTTTTTTTIVQLPESSGASPAGSSASMVAHPRQDVIVVGDLTHLGIMSQLEEYFEKFLHQFDDPKEDWYVLPMLGNHDYQNRYPYLFPHRDAHRWCGVGRAMAQLQYIRVMLTTADFTPISDEAHHPLAQSVRFPVTKRAANAVLDTHPQWAHNSVIDAFHRESGSYAWTPPQDHGRFRMFALHMHPAYEGTCAQRGYVNADGKCFSTEGCNQENCNAGKAPSAGCAPGGKECAGQLSTYGMEACDGVRGHALYHKENTGHCRTLGHLRPSVDWLRDQLLKTCDDETWAARGHKGSRYAVLFVHIFKNGKNHGAESGMTADVIHDLVRDSCVVAVVNGHCHERIGWEVKNSWKSVNKWGDDVPFLFAGSPAMNTWLRMEFTGRASAEADSGGEQEVLDTASPAASCFWRFQSMYKTKPVEADPDEANIMRHGAFRLPACRDEDGGTTTPTVSTSAPVVDDPPTTPVDRDCQLTEWGGSTTTSCSVTCGAGVRRLTREVLSDAVGGGRPCSGFALEKEEACEGVLQECSISSVSTNSSAGSTEDGTTSTPSGLQNNTTDFSSTNATPPDLVPANISNAAGDLEVLSTESNGATAVGDPPDYSGLCC
ncbi:unnamed protein product [Amoebophrya sp. A120]|nr:unnamed protein product [Amoebophrya sp. A120]|eukprot:GSA120T00013441001.1